MSFSSNFATLFCEELFAQNLAAKDDWSDESFIENGEKSGYKKQITEDSCTNNKNAKNKNKESFSLNKMKISFKSSEEYCKFQTELLFADLKSKLKGLAEEALRSDRMLFRKFDFVSYNNIPEQRMLLTFQQFGEESKFPYLKDCRRTPQVLIMPEQDYFTALNQRKIGSSLNWSQQDVQLISSSSLLGILREISFFKDSQNRSIATMHIEVKPSDFQIKKVLLEHQINLNSKDELENKLSFQAFPTNKRLLIVILENLKNKLREFEAIMNIETYRIKDEILNPVYLQNNNNSPIESNQTDVPDLLKLKFNDELNVFQFNAIRGAVQTRGVTLFQGPPGTGKTKTVVALLNIIHIVSYHRYYNSLMEQIKHKYGQQQFKATKSEYAKNNLSKTNKKGNETSTQNIDNKGTSKVGTKISTPFSKNITTKKINTHDMSLNTILEDISTFKAKNSTNAVENILRLKPRILVCAPSNAAVDEIISRVQSAKLIDGNGIAYHPQMIRLGKSEKIRMEIQVQLCIDQRVQAFFKYSEEILKARINEFQAKETIINQSIKHKQKRFASLFGDSLHELSSASNEDEARSLLKMYEDRHNISLELKRLKQVLNLTEFEARKLLTKSFIYESEIVFCTLNGSASREFNDLKQYAFDYLIVDEAAQCTEPDLLIPLRHGVQTIVLVGDSQQLPPTTFINGPKSRIFERSLFERFQHAGHSPFYLLSIQYRMHPEIAKFPNQHFYNSKLHNGPNVVDEKLTQKYHSNPNFGPYKFFNIQSTESRFGTSLFNKIEARFIVQLLEDFACEFGILKFKNIAVITPYREQLRIIRSEIFKSKILSEIIREAPKSIEVATVDFFQGREKDIVVISCVRATSGSSIGFVADLRRLNVSITRAKHSLQIVGNESSLILSPDQEALINDAKQRNFFRNVNIGERLYRNKLYFNNLALESSNDNLKNRKNSKGNSLESFDNNVFKKPDQEIKIKSFKSIEDEKLNIEAGPEKN